MAITSTGLGATLLGGILFVTAMGGQWSDLDMFHYSATVACLLFFGGGAVWGYRLLKEK